LKLFLNVIPFISIRREVVLWLLTIGLADLGEFNNKKNNSNMINSTIELPKMIADFPAPVLANPLLPALPLSETYMMDCIAGMKE